MRCRDRELDRHGLGWALAALAAAAVPHWLALPIWVPALLFVCSLWRWLAELRCWRLPPKWLLLPVGLFGVVGVLASFRTINGVEPGTALLVVMAAVKLLETRSRRDHWVLALIACFLILAAFLRSQSIATALYGLLALWFIATAWLEIGYQGGRLPWRRAIRLSGRYALQAAPLALVLFVLFPRVPGAFWALPTQSAVSGLGDTMSPGDVSELSLSDEVAFRAEFDGPLPQPAQRYWRGPVLHDFDGRTWAVGETGMRAAAPGAIERRGEPLRYRLTVEPHQRRFLPALEMPTALAPHLGYQGFDYGLVSSTPIRRVTSVELTAHPDYVAGLRLSQPLARITTRLPTGRNPQSVALARELRAQGGGDTDYIARVLAMFREQAFFYTLVPRDIAGYDAVDDFLFETRKGFCGHFASAFTVLMRAVGIPARVVTGYQGGQFNPLGGYLIVRQSDAHAWSEVWLEGRGWTRVDPTAAVAPERIERGSSIAAMAGVADADTAGGWVERTRLLWDVVQQSWNDWVIQFGPRSQQSLLDEIGLPGADWRHLTTILVVAMVLASLVLAGLLAAQFRLRRRDEAELLYARFCRRFRGTALVRQPHETANVHLARIARDKPELAPSARAIVRLYLRLRYEPDADAGELSRLRYMVNRFGMA